MYYYLTGAIKRRLINELKDCFQTNPRHDDIVPHIRHKYDFEERPQKGIVLQGASADVQVLSSDNFLGTVESHTMFAQVDNHEGKAIEWVKDDYDAIDANDGEFPSEAGIYYITIDSEMDSDGYEKFKFHVDPLLEVREEPLIEFQTGNESSAFLMHAPVVEDTVELHLLQTSGNSSLLLRGSALRLTSQRSLFIGSEDDSTYVFGLPEGWVPVEAIGSNVGSFTVTSSNDILSFSVNGETVSVTLTNGTLSAADVASEIESELDANIPSDEWDVSVESGAIRIEGSRTLEFEDDAISTSNALLGFDEGFVQPEVTGRVFREWVPERADFRVVSDGIEHRFPLHPGRADASDIRDDLDDGLPSSTTVSLVAAGDYEVDGTTGEVTFLRSFDPGERVVAFYNHPGESTENVPVEPYSSNNTAIPGVILAFGHQLEKGDKMAVVVHPTLVDAASAYGGKTSLSVDMEVITRDATTREEISDLLLMYLFVERKEDLAEEGIVLEDVSFGGESEEVYDAQAENYWFLSSFSVSVEADWEMHVPRPLTIRTVTPVSFEEEARASKDGDVPTADGLKVVEDTTLDDVEQAYFTRRASDFTRIT